MLKSILQGLLCWRLVNLYIMFKQLTSLKRVCLLLCLNLLVLKNAASAYESSHVREYAPKSTTASKKLPPSKGKAAAREEAEDSKLQKVSPIPVEKDFDKIRAFQSYDPATDQWSSIEGFETVEILEDTTQQREDRYIYYSFWAYDPAKKRWYKVDIRDYGYKYRLGKQKAESAPDQSATLPEEEEDQDKDSAWKNLGLSCSVGAGGAFYNNAVTKLQLIERDGEYFLQTQDGVLNNEAHFIRWFSDNYEKRSNFSTTPGPGAYAPQASKKVPFDRNFFFRGYSFSLPVTLALHYTFFKRLRLGAGSNFEFNYLKKLAIKGDTPAIKDYTLPDPWLSNLKWFGLIGFKIMRKPRQAMILDVQIGRVYDSGSRWKAFWQERKYLYANWYFSVGLGYEKKLNNYFKLMTRLSGDYKRYKDTQPFSSGSAVTLSQPAIHLAVGLTFNFGKDTAGNEPEASTAIDEPASRVSNSKRLSQLGKKSSDDLVKLKRAKNRTLRTKDRFKRLS